MRILDQFSRSILSATSGYLLDAGFTHSLTPARNCTYGCTYCYVPTMGLYGGLKPEDWSHWGQHTTFKSNAATLLRKELRRTQRIYCSPLTDPYQPAEADRRLMPEILAAVEQAPPAVFVLQTRGPLILRDLELLLRLKQRTCLRVSFSITTDDDNIRRLYEPHCGPIADRLETIRELRGAGIEVYATLAPILPCNPDRLVEIAFEASGRDVITDPLHLRASKPRGATTREAAFRIARVQHHTDWFEPSFQSDLVKRMQFAARRLGTRASAGVEGFGLLSSNPSVPTIGSCLPQQMNLLSEKPS